VKITGCRFVKVTGRLDKAIALDDGRPLLPADTDPAFAARPFRRVAACDPDPDGVRRVRCIFACLETDAGVSGTTYQVSPAQVTTIREQLLPWLIGRDPLAIEENWDLMFRLLGGGNVSAASTLNCAMWDIRGKLEGAPVYELLGGPKQREIIPYAGMVGHPIELDAVRERARQVKAAGFVAQKWYPPYSLGHGDDSMQRNLAFVRTLRQTVGDEIGLMFDVHQGWTVPYAVEMARAMRPYQPRWLEEPVMSDDVEGYRAVHEAAAFPIAGSEAHRNRWQAEAFLRAGVVDVYQPEPSQACITEMMRIARLVADHGKQMAIHCGYFETLHVVAALPRELCPYYEYLWNWNEYGQWFYRQKCQPVNGVMPLPPGPGLGIELDDDRIDRREEL
jgi:L-alanine-DL-glutamate epimerase-like enolase superfamily enzyme